ncbi:MAG: hypothetical protein HC905_18260 [Bacteroidales bacterium]|nr:hypothetical protein [Bacteroidales bacterium]
MLTSTFRTEIIAVFITITSKEKAKYEKAEYKSWKDSVALHPKTVPDLKKLYRTLLFILYMGI